MVVGRGRLLVCTGIGLGCLSMLLLAFLTGGLSEIPVVISLVILGMSIAYILGNLSASPYEKHDRAWFADRSNREFLRGLTHSTSLPQIVLDTQGVVRSVNQEMKVVLADSVAGMIGLPLEDVLPQFSNQLLSFLEKARFEAEVVTATATGTILSTSYEATLQIIRNDFTGDRWIRVTFQVESTVGTAHDILGRFSAGVAHDLNNLLSSIVGSIEILERSEATAIGEKERKLLAAMNLAGKRGATLARDLLEFSKFSSTTPTGKPVQLTTVVEQAILVFKGVDGAERCALSVSISDDHWVVATDEGLLQILINLLFNSRDAMPDGGDILLAAGKDDAGNIWLDVADTGSGMAPDIVKQAFEPFFSTKKKVYDGTQLGGSGLGLATVQALMHSWDGRIELTSSEGEGTSFRLTFKAARVGFNEMLVH